MRVLQFSWLTCMVAVLSCLTVFGATAEPKFLAQVSSDHIQQIVTSVSDGSHIVYVIARNKAYSTYDLESRVAEQLYGETRNTFNLDAAWIQSPADIIAAVGHLNVTGIRLHTRLGGYLKAHQDRGGLITINNLTNSPIHQLLLQKLNQAITDPSSRIDLSRFTFVFGGENDFFLGAGSNVSTADLGELSLIHKSEAHRLDYYLLTQAALGGLLPCESKLTGAIQAAE